MRIYSIGDYMRHLNECLCLFIFLCLDTISVKKQALLLEEVQKLNRENAERSGVLALQPCVDLEAGTMVEKPQEVPASPSAVDFILEVPKPPEAEQEEVPAVQEEVKKEKQEEKMEEEEILEAAKEKAKEEETAEETEGEFKVEKVLMMEKDQEEMTASVIIPEPEEPAREASPQSDGCDTPDEPVTVPR